ncbi:CopD family copper resistance protein [Achromobacter deleyi]|uniref:CopD family copper resistance protein n=1 Tax=Achromobacter deleyi TaxID=1353891 RepID=UPI0014918352|nr:hypothetical protein [Achromobacter deleyi]QVQ26074.1 hypothetical protein HLG70_25015 [Achromobacter deleyi]UIP21633.1 hypothetical protein LYZ39_03690 [Achromobacter deleyi]
MTYLLLHIVHLFAALVFIGTVIFEVLFLEPVQQRLSADVRKALSQELGPRVRTVMPWVLLVLYGSGLGMAWQYRAVLASPGSSAFGTLLLIKIALATSVLLHVITAMTLARRKRLHAALRAKVHLSVFCHMVGIVLLAKTMFHISW